MSKLFTPIYIKSLELKNRIVMAPMCMYSADEDGYANDWHYTHYSTRAVGGVGLILLEATAVEPRGRISDKDLGLWSDKHIEGVKRIVDLCKVSGVINKSPKVYPGYQVKYAETIKDLANLPVIAGGLITCGAMAEEIVQNNRADLVFLGRELLRNPYWAHNAAKELGDNVEWPKPYERA